MDHLTDRTDPDKTGHVRLRPVHQRTGKKPDGHGHTPLGVSGCPVARSGPESPERERDTGRMADPSSPVPAIHAAALRLQLAALRLKIALCAR
jgi:hypothetical protein